MKFGPGKLFCVCYVCLRDQSFNNFKNDAIKLEANEAKLTSLWAGNCTTIQQVWILKFAFGAKKLPGLSRNVPQDHFVDG